MNPRSSASKRLADLISNSNMPWAQRIRNLWHPSDHIQSIREGMPRSFRHTSLSTHMIHAECFAEDVAQRKLHVSTHGHETSSATSEELSVPQVLAGRHAKHCRGPVKVVSLQLEQSRIITVPVLGRANLHRIWKLQLAGKGQALDRAQGKKRVRRTRSGPW